MYSHRNIARIVFFILGFLIAIGTLIYTGNLFDKLSKEEAQEVSLFAEALKSIGNSQDNELALYWKILEINEAVPILIFDEKDNLVQHKNISFKSEEQQLSKQELLKRKKMHTIPIKITIGKGKAQYVYYGYSPMLYNLRFMPIVQLLLIVLLISVGYIMYKSIQEAKQNKLWAGLSKETAHQMGTPISSLIAWLDLLKEHKEIPTYLTEIEKDIERLKVVSDRFSNIGSTPIKTSQNLVPIIEDTISYMNSRTSKSINIHFVKKENTIEVNLNKELFAWVLENLIKNSIDAIVKKGTITLSTTLSKSNVIIEIADTGKGMTKTISQNAFHPGYSTKKRGWGLGLSLTKRIIKDYHNGRIFVKNSEIDKGTIFRVVLPKTQKEENKNDNSLL